jgi:hypothetical protein
MEVQTLPDLTEEVSRIADEVTRELRRLHSVEEESRLLRERAEKAEEQAASLKAELDRVRAEMEGRITGPAEAVVQVKAAQNGLVAFGHVFPQGKVKGLRARRPDGRTVPLQVSILRTAPDGSVRHALLAADVGPGYEGGLELVGGPARDPESWSGPVALTAEARVTSQGSEYIARPDGPGEVWAEGGLASVRRFRAPLVGADGKPHPRLAAVFDAVLTRTGPVWAAAAIENCWADEDAAETVYDARLVCEGREHREDGIRQLPFTRWRHVFDFDDTGGLGEARLDARYLAGTGAVPSYDTDRWQTPEKALEGLRRDLAEADGSVLGAGVVYPGMPSGGMTRPDIGPLPGWDALTVLSQDPRALAFSRAAGEASAHFAVHYRDRATGRPYSIVNHPTASIHENNSGSKDGDRLPHFKPSALGELVPDSAHSPSLGYVPYLLQPWDRWMLEEVHFWVSFHELIRPWRDGYRKGAQGLLKTGELRGWAWPLRTLALAAWITPDGDPAREEYEHFLDNNLEDSAAEPSPLGWWGSGRKSGPGTEWMADEVTQVTVPWQQDFAVVVWDWLVRLGYPKAAAFRDLIVRGLRGRFLEQPNRFDGTARQFAAIGKTGPFPSWAEIHAKTFANRPANETPADFWHTNRAFDYGAIARAALARAVNGAGAEDLRPVLEQIDASCERFAGEHDGDPRWRIV